MQLCSLNTHCLSVLAQPDSPFPTSDVSHSMDSHLWLSPISTLHTKAVVAQPFGSMGQTSVTGLVYETDQAWTPGLGFALPLPAPYAQIGPCAAISSEMCFML